MEWRIALISAGAALLGTFVGGVISFVVQERALKEQRRQRLIDLKIEVYGRLITELQHCLCCLNAGLTYDPEARDFTAVGSQASLIASPEVMRHMTWATELCTSCRQIAKCGHDPSTEIENASRANANLLRAMQEELDLR